VQAPQAAPSPVAVEMAPVMPAIPASKMKVKLDAIHPDISAKVLQEVRVVVPTIHAKMQLSVPSGMEVVDPDAPEVSYAVMSDEDPTIYGSIADWKTFTKDKARLQGNCIWFEHDGNSYVIDDANLVEQAKELFQPVENLGRQQAALGKQQAALGRQQAELATKQMKVSVKLPDISAEIKGLEEELKTVEAQKGQDFNQEAMVKLQAKIGELQAKFSTVQVQLESRQSGFGAEQSVLGEQQAQLGAQEAELAKEQAKLAKEARCRMQKMIDTAVKDGKARRVD
jgi:hypothetical protein